MLRRAQPDLGSAARREDQRADGERQRGLRHRGHLLPAIRAAPLAPATVATTVAATTVATPDAPATSTRGSAFAALTASTSARASLVAVATVAAAITAAARVAALAALAALAAGGAASWRQCGKQQRAAGHARDRNGRCRGRRALLSAVPRCRDVATTHAAADGSRV